MNRQRRVVSFLIAYGCTLIAGCTYFMSEEEKEAHAELKTAAKAAQDGDWTSAIRHADKSISLHPLPNAYLVRATARMATERGVDSALADVKAGLALDPNHSDLRRMESNLSSMKRLAEMGKSLQSPTLSDVVEKSQNFQRQVTGSQQNSGK